MAKGTARLGDHRAIPAVRSASWPWPTLLTLTSARALAQQVDEPPAEPAPEAPVEVVVVGETPARSAGAVSLPREVLSAAPHRSGSDLLKRVPGVFVTQHSGEGKAHQIFFRGFDALHGQDVEISVAGVPVNEVSNVHGQGYADLHFVIPEVVQQLEARPGALRPDQGDFAVAGSVLYHLGYDEPGFSISGGLGNHGARRLFLAYHPEHAPAETFAAAELYSTDGFGVARAADRASAMGQVLHPLGREVNVRLMASSYTSRFESAGVLRQRDIDAGLVNRFDSYDPDQGGTSQRSQLAAELTHATREWKASLMPYFVSRGLRLRFDFTGNLETAESADGVANSDNTLQSNDSASVGFQARARRRLSLLSERDSFELGVFARHDRIRQQQERTRIDQTQVDARVLATDLGAFADLGLAPFPRTALHLGLRADGLGYQTDDRIARVTRSARGLHLGPKATARVALAPGWHALGGYGAGFRSPQARSLADGEQTPFTRVHSFEAGVTYRDGFGFQGSAAGFASLLSDDLVFDETTSRNEPVPATERVGVALHLQARTLAGFTSACGLSLTQATFRESDENYRDGDAVPFVPQYVGRCDLAQQARLTSIRQRPLSFKVGLGMDMLANRPLPYGELGDNVLLLDALGALSYDSIELALEVTNLLDSEWYDGEFVYASNFAGVPSSAIPERHVSVGAPRSWLLTLTLHL